MILLHLRVLLVLTAIAAAWLLQARIPPPRPRVFRMLGVLIASAFALELYGYLSGLRHATNVLAYNVFLVFEFVLVLVMVGVQQPRIRRRLVLAGALGLLGFVLNAAQVDPLRDLLFEGAVWLSFILAIVLFALLWHMANSSVEPLHRVPVFWLFVGMLLYFIALPPVVGLARYLRKQDLEVAAALWTIMPVLATLRYLLTAYACWLAGRQQRARHE